MTILSQNDLGSSEPFVNQTNWSGFQLPFEYRTIQQPDTNYALKKLDWSGIQIMTVSTVNV
jgi:hypothetical protein